MATHASTGLRRQAGSALDLAARHGLWLSIAATVLVRLAAIMVLARDLHSDGLAYFTMARNVVETGVIADQFGQHAFYSPGYSLLLTPFFRVFGADAAAGYVANLVLAGICAALVWRLVLALGGSRLAALIGGLAFAVWIPSVWGATDLAKENLSTPLLVGFALACVEVARGNGGWRTAALAGGLYGAGLLTGASVVLTGGAFVVALAIAFHRRPGVGVGRLAVFAGSALLVLGPWLAATDAMVGRPVITTNGAFNLYLGNNPAATGHFVSIRETPIGPVWHERVAALGEIGTNDWLNREVRAWVVQNPGHAAALTAKKLALFWAPNVPDGADVDASALMAGLRIIDLVQYAAVLLLAGFALFAKGFDRRLRWTLAALIAGFWVIHGATYIIPRYRDPVMPVLIALAALTATAWLDRWSRARPA